MFVLRCHHELTGPVDCVGDLGGEVAGPGPASGRRSVVDLGGASHDRSVCAARASILLVCERDGIDPVSAIRTQIAFIVSELGLGATLRWAVPGRWFMHWNHSALPAGSATGAV